MKIKICPRCSTEKSMDDFSPQSSSCKTCRAELARIRYAKNPSAKIAKVLTYQRKPGWHHSPNHHSPNSEWRRKYQRERYKINAKCRLQSRVRSRVRWAKLARRLIPAVFCSNCHSKTKIQAHHCNYDKPLEVIWLCRPCHAAIHRKINVAV